MTTNILIIVHQAHSTPGRVGELLEAHGCTLQRCCPNLGDSLPTDLSPYGAVVVFGGPQSANDDHLPGIRAELDWIERTAIPSDKPMLGICLGAQMIARVLGAKVGPHPDGLVEIGYHTIHPTEAGKAYLDGPTVFYQWHKETFGIPRDAVHLAHNEAFSGQAFRYNEHVYALEFHPEMTRAMIERWTSSERGAPMLSLRGAQSRELQLDSFERHAPVTDRWLDRFLRTRLLRQFEL